ncbi:GAF domain-containing protein, partial [Halomicroarcula sp. GCM10025324]|uniref:GAF domain-containing protein n=1 Tax=Halomicroarcula sp. GCM10025324 TaxID=3252667 RepID=UPI00361367CF
MNIFGDCSTWMAIGVIVLSLFLVWFYVFATVLGGREPLDPPIGIVTVPVLGALGGLLIGTYDARAMERKQAVKQLNEINETLRIATTALVEKPDRDGLEQAVCRRLVDAKSINAAWIGRLNAENRTLRPTAWAGFETDDVASLVVPVGDDQRSESVWSGVARTGEARLIQTDVGNETLGQWRDPLEYHGVTWISVVPVVGLNCVYGLISVCADKAGAFDEHQHKVFMELGESLGHAIDSIQVRDALKQREQELVKQNARLDEFAGMVSHGLP